MHTTAIQLLSVSRPTVYQVTDPRVAWNEVVFHSYQKVLFALHQEVTIGDTPLHENAGNESLRLSFCCLSLHQRRSRYAAQTFQCAPNVRQVHHQGRTLA